MSSTSKGADSPGLLVRSKKYRFGLARIASKKSMIKGGHSTGLLIRCQ